MRYIMHGMDAERPDACAADLHARGFSAVVCGAYTEEMAQAAEKHGLDTYLCYGAHGFGTEFDAPAHLAQDVDGSVRKWFSSGCPNDPEIAEARLEEVFQASALPGLRGVLVDGARFASPASSDNADALWTCFCPRCTAKMAEYGFDPEALRQAVLAAKRFCETGTGDIAEVLAGLSDWRAFRARCVSAYMRRFAAGLKAVRSDLEAGAYVFTASLCRLVGQTAEAVQDLDLIAPMQYRRYTEPEGPACLNHEWAALLRLFTARSGLTMDAAKRAFAAWTALPVPGDAPDDVRETGFPPAALEHETAAFRRALPACKTLEPIILLDDDRLAESIEAVRRGGADGCNFFLYDREKLALLPELR